MPPTESNPPHDVLAICGSLRTESSNKGLIRMAERLAAELNGTLRIQFDESIGALPFYNADLENPERMPTVVANWRQRVSSSAALFIASPEYNFGTTALLKNAIDWVSRPPGQHALRGKIVSIVSSSSSTGGKHVLEYYTNVLTLLGNTVVSEPAAGFVKGSEHIFADGSTSDPSVEEAIRHRLRGIADALHP